jgi:hypothetical protein
MRNDARRALLRDLLRTGLFGLLMVALLFGAYYLGQMAPAFNR